MTRPEMLRILDANFNRAREGLRVLEDVARFRYDDALTQMALRGLRHRLSSMERGYAPALVAARDSARDVGREAPTARRADAEAVVTANFKRAQEAMRVLEECGVRGAASVRFALYDLEKRLSARRRLLSVRLYVLLDSRVARRPLDRVAREAIAGGAGMLQLREAGRLDRDLVRLAARLCRVAHGEGALFVVNNRPDIARAAGADGVHVGTGDLPVSAARLVPIVGATTHSLGEARAAAAAGADYVSVGPMFPTALKPDLPARGRRYLEGVKDWGVPFFCIGGITPENVRRWMRRVAVCAGVIAASDVRRAARAIRRSLGG
ncbi:MAG: thiamine phosphate synthase [Planctomycetes bacterium]|nr:thiamine phosphate synthase [Planctomycetota bacterium]